MSLSPQHHNIQQVHLPRPFVDLCDTLYDKGFVHLRSLLSPELATEIRDAIFLEHFGPQHPWFGEKRKDLRLTPEQATGTWLDRLLQQIEPLISPLIGEGAKEIVDIQFSIIEAGRPRSLGWHIDGTWLAKEQDSFEPIPFFRLLVGVYLTDLTVPERGNLIIHPGAHHHVAEYFRQFSSSTRSSVKEIFDELEKVTIPPETQVLAQSGDVLLAHPLLPHSITANAGDIRPALYLRFGFPRIRGIKALSEIKHEIL